MTFNRRPILSFMKLTVAGGVTTAMLVACSSNSSTTNSSTAPSAPASTGGAASSAPAAAGTTGAAGVNSSLPKSGPGTGTGTVKVAIQCKNSGLYSVPECLTTFNALAAYANSNGGINGYKIQLDNCDTSTGPTNPGVWSACTTKQLGQNGDQVMDAIDDGLGITAVADAHGVPIVADTDIEADFDTAPMSFPVYSWLGSALAGMTQYLPTQGFKKPALTTTGSAVAAGTQPAIVDGYKKQGITPKSVVALLTSVSFQPQVETLQSEGVDSVYPSLGDNAIVAMVQEANSIGYHPAWGLLWDVYAQKDEKILGPLSSTSKLYMTTPFKTYGEAGQTEQSIVAKYAPGQPWQFSFNSILDYVGMETLFQALEKMSGPATSAKILQQVRTDNFTSEWLPSSWNWRNITGPACHVAENMTYIDKMENGVWTQVSGPFSAPPTDPVAGCSKS